MVAGEDLVPAPRAYGKTMAKPFTEQDHKQTAASRQQQQTEEGGREVRKTQVITTIKFIFCQFLKNFI